ncbi:cold shock domain-containing protein E1-like isoform X2 [Styela clava]
MMWMNTNQPSPITPLGRWPDGQFPNNQSVRSNFGSSAGSIALTTQQKALITGGINSRNEIKEKQLQPSHRTLSRTISCGVFPSSSGLRPSALNQHRALQRSTSYDSNHRMNQTMPALGSRPSGLSPTTSPSPAGLSTSTNGYRSRETGVIEKLLLSYGFIRCADREGRLFFHYSQFHGEAHNLNINDEVEFDVSMDTRTGKPVAVQVVKLKKGTVVFEVYSEERILGEVANAAAQGGQCPQSPMSPTVNGFKPGEKGETTPGGKYGSLCYDRMGQKLNGKHGQIKEVFFLPYSVNDLTNKNLQLQPGDKVSFYIATEKRTGILRARKITLVERAPPKRFIGIVTAMKESFGFIERADLVKEIFFHYSEVSNNVPDLHVGDHVEYCVQDRNGKEVATNIRLLPPGSVQLEEISSEIFVGIVERPLPPKAPNKLPHNQMSNAGGDATTMAKANGNLGLQPQQPTVTLAGIIQYTSPLGESRKIRFGEKDRAANCVYTLCKGDKVSFLTVTDKRNGQQRAAGVNLLLKETLEMSGEKREMGIVAAVKEGFGFIKCLERDSRLFFHCCELLDPNHCVRMSDEVAFTVLNDPVAEKHRLHATRITVLPKGTVIFHTMSEKTYTGVIDSMPGTPMSIGSDCLISPALGPNPGFISYEDDSSPGSTVQIPFLMKDFAEWTEASTIAIGSMVQFNICTLKRTGAKNAVEIRLMGSPRPLEKATTDMIRDIVSGLSSLDTSLPHTNANTSPPASTTTPRTPIMSSPMKMVPLIEDVSLVAPAFNLGPTPPRKSKSSAMVSNSPTDCPSSAMSPSHDINTSSSRNALSSSNNLADDKSKKVLGWISTLKETFGFIETADHGSEIFFHFSELQDSPEKFNVNTPVVYIKGVKEDKPCAMNVTIANEKEDLFHEVIDPTIYNGIVMKPLKSGSSVQPAYQGIIEYDSEQQIKYSPLSLSDRRDFIQASDKVTFQICSNTSNNQVRAVNVSVKRETIQATVESVKGEYGFINYEVKNTDSASSGKLFFHMSEVREGADEITTGTLVEFSVIFNQRTGKHSASGVRCLESKRQRPERLRLRSSCCEPIGPVVTVIRQPRGPNGDKGFSLKRNVSSDGEASSVA